jgi:acetyltransferase
MYQGRGLGALLVGWLLQFARDENIDRVTAEVLAENRAMRRLLEKQGFEFSESEDPSILHVERRVAARG